MADGADFLMNMSFFYQFDFSGPVQERKFCITVVLQFSYARYQLIGPYAIFQLLFHNESR